MKAEWLGSLTAFQSRFVRGGRDRESTQCCVVDQPYAWSLGETSVDLEKVGAS